MPDLTGQRMLVAFDIDGTLTKERSSWQYVHRSLHTESVAHRNERRFQQGILAYEQWAKADALLWKGVPVAKLQQIVNGIRLNYSVRKAIAILKAESCYVGAISNCVSPLADRLSRELGLSFFFSDELQYNNGRLTGEIRVNVTPANKHILLQKVARQMRVPMTRSVAVGDSWVDAKMLQVAGLGIAFRPRDSEVAKVADVIVQGDFAKIVHKILSWRGKQGIASECAF